MRACARACVSAFVDENKLSGNIKLIHHFKVHRNPFSASHLSSVDVKKYAV